ncbi:MAG: carbamate kinase [Myxococcota bacterium]
MTGPEKSQKRRPIVMVALGGHAFIGKGEKGDVHDHERNAALICEKLMTLIERDYNVVITHGNGPQVGNRLLATERTRDEIPTMPLDVLVAETEGSLGYFLQQALLNELRRRKSERYVVTVITQVLVEKDDPAFQHPTKPIGPFMTEEEANRRAATMDWKVVEDAGRGWRRVVASPKPNRVIQHHTIREAAREGDIVVACGGGGIPIFKNDKDDYEGIECVIDKDLTSSVLANQIGAELLVILTSVPKVYLNFGKPDEVPLGAVTMEEIEDHIAKGHFPPGSMGPKIQAIHEFLQQGGKRGLITDPEHLLAALDGRAGTHFVGRI